MSDMPHPNCTAPALLIRQLAAVMPRCTYTEFRVLVGLASFADSDSIASPTARQIGRRGFIEIDYVKTALSALSKPRAATRRAAARPALLETVKRGNAGGPTIRRLNLDGIPPMTLAEVDGSSGGQ